MSTPRPPTDAVACDAAILNTLFERATQALPQEAGALADTTRVRVLTQAFFHANLAEKIARMRRQVEAQAMGTAQAHSLQQVVQAARDNHVPSAVVIEAALAVQLEPVFTAHPTQATRSTLLRKEARTARALVQRRAAVQEGLAQPQARAEDALMHELSAGWQTDPIAQAPTVADEAGHVRFYLTEVLYPIVPAFFEGMLQAIERAYGPEVAQSYNAAAQDVGPTVRFCTWVGGDMDGNPNVGAHTLTETLEQQRRAVLSAYEQDVRKLAERLSQSPEGAALDTELQAGLQAACASLPGWQPQARYLSMPYRTYLSAIAERLAQSRTVAHSPAAYRDPQELHQALGTIARSLDAHTGVHGGAFAVRRLMRQVSAFGLHLAALDVRQDSLVHREAVGALLGDADWLTKSEVDRTAQLTAVLQDCVASTPPWTAEAVAQACARSPALMRSLEVMRAIRAARARHGTNALGLYIISMAQHVDDLLAVLVLAHAAQLTVPGPHGTLQVPLDVAPLFETVPDLQRAPGVLAQAFAHAEYARHLAARGGVQHVMLGYSDSNKESGFVASRWAIRCAEEALIAAADPTPFALRLFHGRGGTASRGGTALHRAILQEPRATGYLRLTEQGEMIHGKYGFEPLALRTLELMGGALLRRQWGAPPPQSTATQRAALAACAAASRTAYRALVVDDPRFFPYFQRATPIDVISRLAIGSRPASRRASQGIGDLRAIPWIFAWAQNRQMISTWLGLGEGLEAAIAQVGLAAVRALYAEWPVFTALVRDAARELGRCDLTLGALYAGLADAADRPVWEKVQAHYQHTVAQVLKVTQWASLNEADAALSAALLQRREGLAELHRLQVHYLAAWRAGDRQDAALTRLLLLSVRGIAQGLSQTA